MDEPTAYLDPWAAASFFLGLKEVLAESTLVLVEHRTAEARGLVSRAVVLEKYAGLTELPPHSASCPSEVIGDGELWDGTAIEGRPLRIEALSHRYPGAGPVWSGLTAEFRPGRISGIMGPSGSGKSTLLKKLAGLLPSPRTTLFWGEEDLTRLSPRKLYSQLLYLPQNPEHFFFCMSVAQEWLSTGATPAQIEKAARLFGLDPRSPLHPGTLSEGEKRRLTLALAFLDPRPILLLDEPTYGLDQQSFSTLARGLKALRNQGRTVVLVTHSPELVRACVDDLWLLSEGGWSSISVDSLERLLPEASLV
jgi:energy-coupling factor transport system ATP-binding protein